MSHDFVADPPSSSQSSPTTSRFAGTVAGSTATATATADASYGSSLSKVEPYGTEEIPDSERHGGPSSQFTLWFAANMVLAVLVSGFFAASFGLSIAQGLSAVAVGSLMGSLVMGLLAGIGTRFGVPQQVQARGPMGYKLNTIPILLLTNVSAIGWVSVNTVFAVLALQYLVDIPFWVGAVGLFTIQALFAIMGHNLIHMVNRVATIVLAILFAIITVLALTNVEPAAAPSEAGFAEWMTFSGFFFVYVMTWTPFASDFSRYLPRDTSHVRIVVNTAGGSFVALLWLGSIGVLVSSFAGDLGAVDAVAQLTGSWAWLAMLAVVLGTIPVSAMNLYGGALSLLTIGVPVQRHIGVVITSVISLLLTLWMAGDPYGSFYDFLNLLGYLIVPFTTVLLMDYFFRTRAMGAAAITELEDRSRFGAWGFVAWLVGCLVSSLAWTTPAGNGALQSTLAPLGEMSYFVGAFAAAITYLIIHAVRRGNPDIAIRLPNAAAPADASASAQNGERA